MDDERYAGGLTAQEYRQALRRLSEPPDDEEESSPFAMPASDTRAAPTPESRAPVSARLAAVTLPSTAAALRRLGRRTTVVLWVGVALSVVALAAAVLAFTTGADLIGANAAQATSRLDAQAAYVVVSGLLGVWILVGGAVFVAWLHRMYSQAALLRPARFTWRPGWAIAGWFVPLLNLYLPYRLTADISRSVDDRVRASVKVWWILLLCGALLSGYVAWMLFDGGLTEPLSTGVLLGAAAGATVYLLAGLTAVAMVRGLSRGVVVATQRLAPARPDDVAPR